VKSHPSCSSPWSFLRLLRPQAGHAEEQWSSTMTMTASPFGSREFGPMGRRADVSNTSKALPAPK
jgi:hypothetical protein